MEVNHSTDLERVLGIFKSDFIRSNLRSNTVIRTDISDEWTELLQSQPQLCFEYCFQHRSYVLFKIFDIIDIHRSATNIPVLTFYYPYKIVGNKLNHKSSAIYVTFENQSFMQDFFCPETFIKLHISFEENSE